MAALGSLVVSLGLDAADFTKGLSKSEIDAKRFAQNMAEVGRQAGTLLAAGALAGVAGLVALTKSAINSADHLRDLSQQTGITVEALGGIGFAASQAGGSLESASAAAGKLNKQLAEASAGNKEASEAFKALGISVKDAAGNTISADAAMVKIADKFAGFTDGPEKAALALRLFGKAGADIIPLLNDGGDALQNNIAYYERFSGVTTQVAKQADEFNDTLGKLNLVVGAFGRELAAQLLPALQAVAEAVLKAKEESQAFVNIAGGIRVIFETIAVVGANVAFVFNQVGQTIGAYLAVVGRLAQFDLKGAKTIGEAYREQAEAGRKSLEALERKILQVDKLSGGGFQGDRSRSRIFQPDVPAPKLPGDKATAAKISEAQRYLEALQKQFEKTQELTVAEQALLDIQKGRIEGITPKLRDEILATARLIDAKKVQTDLLRSEQQAREAVSKMVENAAASAAAETAQLVKGNDELRHEIALLGADEVARTAINNARIESLITLKEEQLQMLKNADAIGTATLELEAQIAVLRERQRLSTTKADIENFQGVQKHAEDAFKENEKVKNGLAESIEEGILEGFRKGKSFADIFINELKAQFAKTILRPIIAPVAEAGNTLINALLQGVLGAMTGGGGGSTTGDFARMDRGQSIGREIPQSMSKASFSGGGGPQIVQNINIGDYATRNDVLNAMTAATEKAKSDILRSQRSNGQFANA